MGLVAYSDSEGSEDEATSQPSAATTSLATTSTRPIVSKPTESGPRKIKVDLPAPVADPSNDDSNARPSKIRRLGTGFGSFNDFLPAPKVKPGQGSGPAGAINKNGIRPGMSFKTSSEAAFSRAPVESTQTYDEPQRDAVTPSAPVLTGAPQQVDNLLKPQSPQGKSETVPPPNPLRFKPLSVTNKKKPKRYPGATSSVPSSASSSSANATASKSGTPQTRPTQTQPPAGVTAPAAHKPKTSLFSLSASTANEPTDRVQEQADHEMTDYQPILQQQLAQPHQQQRAEDHIDPAQQYLSSIPTSTPDSMSEVNTLESIATDLGLSAAERRQLMGGARGSSNNKHRNRNEHFDAQKAPSVMQFDMETEYARNEALRLNGELNEHRAVKAVAPGKHSLQQLVNAASSQKEALEDAWAQGRRNKAESGANYGFAR